jgi:hypothetical protein
MAKVIAPFKIQGTLDDLNFVVNADGTNYVRMKGKTGVTTEDFKNNPIFDRIRNQGKEMGYCTKKARTFRLLAKYFFDRAKEVSSAGRVNKLLLEILAEDTTNPKGERTIEEGIKSEYLQEILIGFEANKIRPLDKVLLKKGNHNTEQETITWTNFSPEKHIAWPPEEATHVQFQTATAFWDITNDSFQTVYSTAIILDKKAKKETIQLTTNSVSETNKLKITFLFIGFLVLERKKRKELHRKHNTATIIACQKT